MFSERRLVAGGMVSAVAVVWLLIALGTPNGFSDLLIFLGPAVLLAAAVAWLFFTFAGNLFTWSRALRSVIAGAAVLTPVLAYFFSGSKDQSLISKFLFMIAVGWAASLGGTLWGLAGAASDALREWRMMRKSNQARRLYVPVQTIFAAIATTALLVGCASRPTPVPVIGPRSDMSALVGEWSGEYSSPETGRNGSIVFTLQAGKDTAFGSVVMVPRAQTEPTVPGPRPTVTASRTPAPGEFLTIRFVRMEGNQVMGTLDPYRDPDCGCRLTTTFRGAFTDAATIAGTFNTVGSAMGHMPSSGRWTVKRVVP